MNLSEAKKIVEAGKDTPWPEVYAEEFEARGFIEGVNSVDALKRPEVQAMDYAISEFFDIMNDGPDDSDVAMAFGKLRKARANYRQSLGNSVDAELKDLKKRFYESNKAIATKDAENKHLRGLLEDCLIYIDGDFAELEIQIKEALGQSSSEKEGEKK